MLNYPFKFFAILLQVDRKQIDCVNKVCVQKIGSTRCITYYVKNKIENAKFIKVGRTQKHLELVTLKSN